MTAVNVVVRSCSMFAKLDCRNDLQMLLVDWFVDVDGVFLAIVL